MTHRQALHHKDPLDQTTSDRLATLSDRPVDDERVTARFDELLADSAETSPVARLQHWLRPVAAAAAIVMLAITGFWFTAVQMASPVQATPSNVVQVHQEIARGHADITRVSSFSDVNRWLAQQGGTIRSIAGLTGGQPQSCCFHDLGGVKATCIQMQVDGKPVTLMLAEANQLSPPEGEVFEASGRRFITHRVGGANMLMTEIDGQWVCMTGELPNRRLARLANSLKLTRG
jgi:hypothetical protein